MVQTLNYVDDFNEIKSMNTVGDINLILGLNGSSYDLHSIKDNDITIKIANEDGYIKDIPVNIANYSDDDKENGIFDVEFDKEIIEQFPPDIYYLEAWLTNLNGAQLIFPSDGALPFKINPNLVNGSNAIPMVTFYQIQQDWETTKELIFQHEAKIERYINSFTNQKSDIADDINNEIYSYRKFADSLTTNLGQIKSNTNVIASKANSSISKIDNNISDAVSGVQHAEDNVKANVQSTVSSAQDRINHALDTNSAINLLNSETDKIDSNINNTVSSANDNFYNIIQSGQSEITNTNADTKSIATSVINSTESLNQNMTSQNVSVINSLETKTKATNAIVNNISLNTQSEIDIAKSNITNEVKDIISSTVNNNSSMSDINTSLDSVSSIASHNSSDINDLKGHSYTSLKSSISNSATSFSNNMDSKLDHLIGTINSTMNSTISSLSSQFNSYGNNSNQDTNSLKISDDVIAKNEEGYLTVNGKAILLADVPSTPILKDAFIQNNSLKVKITLPENDMGDEKVDSRAPILEYRIYYKKSSDKIYSKGTTKSKNGVLRLDNPTTSYNVYITAINASGSSSNSNMITTAPPKKSTGIFGAKWDRKGNSSLIRIDDAVKLVAGVNGDHNDFDKIGPWGKMQRVTDSRNNVFIRIPKTYVRKTQTGAKDNGQCTWQVSLNKQTGTDWYLPLCFWDFDNEKELPYIDVAAYDAGVNNNQLTSKSGETPLVNRDINNFRTLATKNGKEYQLLDIHTVDLLQVLYLIEFATFDTPIEDDGVSVADEPSHVMKNGNNDEIKGSYNENESDDEDTLTTMSYRGIENLFSNTQQWIDGINLDNGNVYVCDDAKNYQSNTFRIPYAKLNYHYEIFNPNNEDETETVSNEPAVLGYDPQHPSAQIVTKHTSQDEMLDSKDYYINSAQTIQSTCNGVYLGQDGSPSIFSLEGSNYTQKELIDNNMTVIGARLVRKAS